MNTEIIVIADRSGSMSNITNDAIGGFNTFIEEQQKIPGEAKVTFAQFDTEYEVVYAGKSLTEVPKLDSQTYVPRGMTALLDAIGKTLTEQGERIAKEDWADLAIVCIITDGLENSSTQFTQQRIAEMTSHAEKNGWKFIYLGANQDSFLVAKSLGMNNAIVDNYIPTSAGIHGATVGMSLNVSNLRNGNYIRKD